MSAGGFLYIAAEGIVSAFSERYANALRFFAGNQNVHFQFLSYNVQGRSYLPFSFISCFLQKQKILVIFFVIKKCLHMQHEIYLMHFISNLTS